MVIDGPKFLMGGAFAGDNSLATREAKKAEAAATDQYRRWAASWILPLLQELVPELRQPPCDVCGRPMSAQERAAGYRVHDQCEKGATS
jgi:hypothetical protein